ncbi:RICIN domain-containing protein [Streptomyces sp. NPDC006458]|uniref:RICIN domain-containing protein n=1 Tax=Streptomyces sp. NPDC006458 TaxID=3154302 RepID=UPI0033AC1703
MSHTSRSPRPGTRRRLPRGLRAAALAGTAAALALPMLASPPAAAADAEQALTVRLDPSYQQPAFEGWGTALAWFANVTGGWPDAQRNALADALYGSDGLGFTVARYNIGGGDSPETTPYMRAGAAVPGYWNRPGAESPDWWDPNNAAHWKADADANQRWWLSAAKARGADTFEAFSNSAPYFMTNSGLVSGNWDGNQDNLRSDQYDRFAAYLTGSLRRAEQSTGVTFDSVSPINEPNTNYWHAGGRQEGSHWDPSSQARMITTLRSAMNAQGIGTPIAAMDETNPGKFRENWESYGPTVRAAVGRLNTHTYGTGGRTAVRDIAKGERHPVWMSEVDLGGSVGQSFTDMSPALDLAGRINDDIRELEPSAWVLWQAVEDYENMTPGRENSNWGLIQTDFTPDDAATEPLRKNKKYWAMAQYSRFVRPGSRVIATDDGNTLAALRPNGGVVVVHTNPTGAARDVTLDLDGFATTAGAVERYTTDADHNLERGSDLQASDTLRATVGAGSVTTFVLPGVTGVDTTATSAPTGGTKQLLNDRSGLALTAATSGGKTLPVQRNSNPADTSQQWTFTKLSASDWGSNAAYRITNARTGKALSVSQGALGFASPGSSTAQQWIRSTTGDGHATLVNAASGLLLEVVAESTADGAAVGVYRPTTGAHQSWSFRATAPDTWRKATFQHSSKCLGVTGASTADGATVGQFACNGATNQQWALRPATFGYVSLVARNSGKCLDVAGESLADGASVFQYGCTGGRNQEWAVRDAGNGKVTLRARHSGKCLGVQNASTGEGAFTVQQTCSGSTAQRLTLS